MQRRNIMKRNANETFEDYKKRRMEENIRTKELLSGNIVIPTSPTNKVARQMAKLERKSKKISKDAVLAQQRLVRSGAKIQAKLDEMEAEKKRMTSPKIGA
jgi:hypothetical protein